MKHHDVSRLQEGLNSAGYDSGLLDGVLGPVTLSAAATYLYHEFGETGVAEDALARLKTKPSTELLPGIDVSAYNGEIDWKTVAEAGIKYCWVKCSEGTTHKNRRRQENLDGARAFGIHAAGYHFARPDTYQSLQLEDAKNEAHNFLQCYGTPQPDDLVPMVDLESGLLKNDQNYNIDWINEWCYTVEQELGLKPRKIVMYTARWATTSRILKAEPGLLKQLAEHPLWWAEYHDEEVTEPSKIMKPWKNWDIWQWTGYGSVPGIEGRVDENWMKAESLEKLKFGSST